MENFLNFETFIALDLLKLFYLVGSLMMPFILWYSLFWVIKKYAVLIRFYGGLKRSIWLSLLVWLVQKLRFFKKYIDRKITWSVLTLSQKAKFIALYLMVLFFAEVFYRLVLEYLIAFMQMHEQLKLL